MDAERRTAGGRPRAFDEDQALDRAIDVFWRLGYEGASLTELTQAMGINKPSLYAVFGSKEELFVRALERYGLAYHEHLDTVLARSTAYEVIESYLRSTVTAATRAGDVPRGCLSIQGGLACAPNNAHIPRLLADYRQGLEDAVAKALAKTTDASGPAGGLNAAALAGYAVTIGQGIAVHAAAGVQQAKLDDVVDVALAGLASLLAA
ncbi:TetR/AcrR family transcriptional regulator [Mycolicibacterium hippocampi]|uniref:Transcriptional regulator, AcrR family n=1 Tax=Mycolicibacterium hippocampi TaxID=659824 RepID=A0A850PW53_9MYCO|nr:TetR/AcrR family transcriptional regulator [Mycolicibacterium hippocampi]NVN52683.1 Transcriptional regulator, AcrR family [Mycolicibacterium hippocampi]